MAIDLRQSHATYTDRCKFYKAIKTVAGKVTQDPTCAGVFYADEQSPEYETMEQMGAVLVKKVTTTIKTPDIVDELHPDDFVDYNGNSWIVTGKQTAETSAKSKQFSSNPPHETLIQLRR